MSTLHLINVTLFVYVLTPIISFHSFPVLCYALEEVNNLLNATAKSISTGAPKFVAGRGTG
jgi:hypothetical protein